MHKLTLTPAKESKYLSTGEHMKSRFHISLLAVLVAAFFISACATLKENDAVVRLVLQQATLRAIDASGHPESRATRVIEIVGQARKFAQGNPQSTVDVITQVVVAQIDFAGMSPADQLLVRDLISIATAEIQNRINAGDLDGEQLVYVDTVLGYIESAAQLWLDAYAA